ncbi:MAG: dethiobiotin synthase [Planctomycetes bacterium]|nr:dethiobiotin synthase [Planctomycetota bacterium]
MSTKPAKGLFITGTDTGVGKTYVAALIAKSLAAEGLRVGVYKPAASGCGDHDGRRISEDAEQLWEAAGRPASLSQVCPQMFLAPLAPHLAARAEGKEINAELLRAGLSAWADRCDIVLVEGAGGLMSPLSDDDYVADLALEFGYPLVVVAPNVLGVINQTLQTLITASVFREGVPVAGVVLNHVRPAKGDASTATNLAELQRRCVPPVLAEVAFGGEFSTTIRWSEIAAATSPRSAPSQPGVEA